MQVRSMAVLAALVGLVGCAIPEAPGPDHGGGPASASIERRAEPPGARPPTRTAPESRGMYRLDFTLTMSDPGSAPTSSEYTLSLEEHSPGEIRQGRNVALVAPGRAPAAAASGGSPGPSTATMRQDVGFLLRCNFMMVGDALTLHTDAEMSSMDEVAGINKVMLKGDALVNPGKATLVSSSEDPVTHRRYQLSVTATKLR